MIKLSMKGNKTGGQISKHAILLFNENKFKIYPINKQ